MPLLIRAGVDAFFRALQSFLFLRLLSLGVAPGSAFSDATAACRQVCRNKDVSAVGMVSQRQEMTVGGAGHAGAGAGAGASAGAGAGAGSTGGGGEVVTAGDAVTLASQMTDRDDSLEYRPLDPSCTMFGSSTSMTSVAAALFGVDAGHQVHESDTCLSSEVRGFR